MLDQRLKKLAKSLVTYSTSIQKGDRCLVTAIDTPHEFVAEIIDNIWAAGGIPHVRTSSSLLSSHLAPHYSKEIIEENTALNIPLWENLRASILIDGSDNVFDDKNIPPEVLQLMATISGKKRHEIYDRNNVKWALLNYPNATSAYNARMSTEEFEDFYLDVCTVDYAKMKEAMTPLCELIESTDKVRLLGKDTNLTFSIKGQKACKCAGQYNIPDGEVFTSPLRTSVNGTVTFNVPLSIAGDIFENIKLTVKEGKIVQSDCNNPEAFRKLLDTDAGARYFGEFAFGVNPMINQPMKDTLFDEKISGSFHMAFGQSLLEAPNGNESGMHVDMIQIQTPEYGGGEIWFDNVLIRKDGLFVPDRLKVLNPENLK